MSIATAESPACELPDGVNTPEGVLVFAGLAGYEGDHLPAVVIMERGFSEPAGFFREAIGRGYYMLTKRSCTCPSYVGSIPPKR